MEEGKEKVQGELVGTIEYMEPVLMSVEVGGVSNTCSHGSSANPCSSGAVATETEF